MQTKKTRREIIKLAGNPTKLDCLTNIRWYLNYLEEYLPNRNDTIRQIRKLIDTNTSKCFKMQKAENLVESFTRRIKSPYIADDCMRLLSEIKTYLKMSDFRLQRKITPFGKK